ncbi:MAG: YjbQ family protein [Candidatus Heimdallarchaeota archaeon]|nr:YjbQ family protein [Candidatus Heimdallarchaeota archaeon]
MIQTYQEILQTNGEIELIDLTNKVMNYLAESKITDGTVHISCPGSTSAVITTEFEPGVVKDTKDLLNKLIPKGIGYEHDKIDNNAHSHLRASFLGANQTIPIKENRLLLGTWQQIVFVELDVRPRTRTVIFQFMGIIK